MRALALITVVALGSAGLAAPHAPIVIASDADFTRENGVMTGSGTPDDPYVISGWEIEAGAGVGILVKRVSAAFVIRDCRITGRPQGTGVSVVSARGARVEGCRFVGLGTGVFLYSSFGARVQSCSFSACWVGLEGSESDSITVKGNVFSPIRKRGVFLWRCHDGHIVGNVFSGGEAGVYLDSCNRDRVAGNSVEGADEGLFLWDSFSCVVTENVLRGCQLGVALVHTSAGNQVYRNAFFACARPATCDEADNSWDGGYPTGGNYWGDIPVEDRYSGPGQDLPGGDGIGDTPVDIPFSCQDRYPLLEPPDEGGLK